MKRGFKWLHLERLEDRTVPSAPGDIEWVRQFGSTVQGTSIGRAVDADGNVYVGGDVFGTLPGQTSVGDTDAFVRKLDAAGNELWTRQFGTPSTDTLQAIAADASGIYLVGQVRGALPGQQLTGSQGDYDAFLRKYDANGTELWTREFGTVAIDTAGGVAADATGVYVAGYTEGVFGQNTAGVPSAFVRKYDLGGTLLWTRQFSTTGVQLGGVITERTPRISVSDSGIYLGWDELRQLVSSDVFLRKYDTNGNTVWTRQFNSGDCGGVAADADGVYVVGSTGPYVLPGQTQFGQGDAFIRRYDAGGIEAWTRQFGTAASDSAFGIDVNATGVYVAGTTNGTFSGQTGAGSADVFVRKYDASGNEAWTQQFGTGGGDTAYGVAVDASGVYVAGLALGTLVEPGSTSPSVFVRKYDSGGTVVWNRQFAGGLAQTDIARAVDADGNVYLAGELNGVLPGEAITASRFMFVRKYDASGTVLWTRRFGFSIDRATGIAVDSSGVYVTGWTSGALPGQTFFGGFDSFVRKYDADGNELWTRQFGTSGDDKPFGLAVDGSDLYVGGFTTGTFPGQTKVGLFNNDAFVRKYDAAGNVLWTNQFGTTSDDQVLSVAVDSSGVYAAGNTSGLLPSQTSAGGQDAFVRAYDAAGNALWTRQFGNAGTDSATGIAADASGVYVAGSNFGVLPGGGSSAGGQDAYVRKYDTSGNAVWTRQFGTSGSDQANGIAVGASGVYVAGFVTGALPGRTSAGGQDLFVRKYDTAGAVIWTGQFGTAATDSALGVNVGTAGLFVAGMTTGTFPGQTGFGLEDAFVAKIVDTVSNTAPSNLVLTLSGSVNENGTATLNGSFTDPDAADSHTVVINWGPGEGSTSLNLPAGVTTFAVSHPYFDDNPTGTTSDLYAITVTVADAGASTVGGANLTVNNVAPTVSITGPAGGAVFTIGTPIAFTGAFTDAGTGDTHTAQWLFDAVAGAGTVIEIGGSGTVSGSYTFAAPGVYTVKLMVTDDDGGTSTDQILVTIVRRPTTTTTSVSAASPLLGVDSMTISATVAVVAPGGGEPTGSVTFYDGTTVLGTVDLITGTASLALGSNALAAGSHTIRVVYSGDGNFAESETAVAVNVLAPSTIQGMVYVDFNNDGLVDLGERAVAGVTVTLAGTDDLGQAVSRTIQTDMNGVYAFVYLRPSDPAGYTLSEIQPAGLLDGRDTLGTVNGVATGNAAVNDSFSAVVLSQSGSIAENYNFGERPTTNGGVVPGQTATIGYWQNPNGQSLIRSLNGGPTATEFGRWLAVSFPNMYAALDGMTNADVAAYYKRLFARTNQTAPGGPPKVDCQVMATAIAVYVTNQNLAGMAAIPYGFQVSATGLGTRTYNVGTNGAVFGVANNSAVSVMDLLLAVNARARNGLLYDLNGNGVIDGSEVSDRTMANIVFSAINEAGDI